MGCQLPARPHQDRVERKTARRRCPVQVEVAWTPALPLALVVPAGPSPDGAGLPCSQSGVTGYTNSRPSGRRQPGGDTQCCSYRSTTAPSSTATSSSGSGTRPPDQGWRRRPDRAPVLAVLTVLAVLEYNRVERGAGDTSPDPTAGPLWHHPEQEPPGRGVTGCHHWNRSGSPSSPWSWPAVWCWGCGRFVADAGAAEAGRRAGSWSTPANQLAQSST